MVVDQDEADRIRNAATKEAEWRSNIENRLKGIEAGIAELNTVRDKITAWAWRIGGIILLSMLPQAADIIHILIPGLSP